jgi:NAD(P)-dependent dehydrogenase (short-subunit alcohol dehydrogenase family)
VVTGANRGLGKAVSIELARRGASVAMICRDRQRGEAAKREAMKAGDKVELFIADLGSLGDVRRVADEISRRYSSIRAFVSTAAVFTAKRSVTGDGLETMFATNHLAPYLLGRLLLPALERGAPSHVIIVTAPATTTPNFEDLQGERKFSSYGAFGASMVGKLLFSKALARRVAPAKINVIAIHPGLMKTDLMRESPAPLRFMLRLISRSPERAATGVANLISGEIPAPSGSFVAIDKVKQPPRLALDQSLQDRMWEESARLTGLPI